MPCLLSVDNGIGQGCQSQPPSLGGQNAKTIGSQPMKMGDLQIDDCELFNEFSMIMK